MATSGGTVLAFALNGSSDVIGALAWARACGYERLVLVQPGSPPRGAASTSLELQPVPPAAPGTPAPGGSFFDNGSMVAYLLSLDATQLVAATTWCSPRTTAVARASRAPRSRAPPPRSCRRSPRTSARPSWVSTSAATSRSPRRRRSAARAESGALHPSPPFTDPPGPYLARTSPLPRSLRALGRSLESLYGL